RTFSLDGGQIQRLVYPFLILNVLQTSDVSQYDVLPGLTTQSPDRRWLLVQHPGGTYQFDVFDLAEPEEAPEIVVVPPNILTNPGANSSIKLTEWSNDNRHVVFERTYDNTSEFILLDREKPQESININTTFG